jgi:hypothetical protein
MAYFVRGIPKLSQPKSPLANLNANLQFQQKAKMQEKQQQRQALLQLANMKMREQQQAQQNQMALMRMQEQRAKEEQRDEQRLDQYQGQNLRELRRVQGSAELEPYAQDHFDMLVQQRMRETNNLRDPDVGRVNAALDDILNFVNTYSIDDDYNKQLNAFQTIATDEVEQQDMNTKLESNFQRIDTGETSTRYDRSRFIADGGLANEMTLQIAPLGQMSTIVGAPLTGFDDQGNPMYGSSVTPLEKNPLYHNSETEYMRTAMSPFFGPSFSEIGKSLQRNLKTNFNNQEWREESTGEGQGAREYVQDILYASNTRGRQWRMRSLLGDITDPNNNEPSDGLYYQLNQEASPEVRKKVMDMVVNYDIRDEQGNLRPLYVEYQTEIERGLRLAEDRIVAATNYNDPPAPRSGRSGRSGSSSGTNYIQQTVNSRRATDVNGVWGSLYSPQFLRSYPIDLPMDNSAAVQEWNQNKEARRQEVFDDTYAAASGTDDARRLLADRKANDVIANEFPDREAPDDQVEVRVETLIVTPDGVAPDGTASLYIVDSENNRRSLSSTDNVNWGRLANKLSERGVDINTLLNDMDQGWWDADDPEVRAAGGGAPPAQPQPQANQPAAPQQPASSFPSYPEWKENNPDGSVADWRAAKAAAAPQ